MVKCISEMPIVRERANIISCGRGKRGKQWATNGNGNGVMVMAMQGVSKYVAEPIRRSKQVGGNRRTADYDATGTDAHP